MYRSKVVWLACCTLWLAGCQDPSGENLRAQFSETGQPEPASIQTASSVDFAEQVKAGARLPTELSGAVPKDKVNTITRALAAEGLRALDDGRLDEASELFNTALRLDLGNSTLQFLNALTYHLMAVNGNAKRYALAEQGYSLAYKFDNTNVLARYYQGLAFIDQRKFAEAQAALAAAAVMDDSDPEILYDLARASYHAGDPRTADAALKKLASIGRGPVEEIKFLRASIITNAALNATDEAQSLLEDFSAAGGDSRTVELLSRRISAWARFHSEMPQSAASDLTLPSGVSPGISLLPSAFPASPADFLSEVSGGGIAETQDGIQLAQDLPGGSAIPGIPGAIEDAPVGSLTGPVPGAPAQDLNLGAEDFVNADMVVVDVVIIRTQEDISTNKGLNLLSGLQLQFGEPLSPTPGFSFARIDSDDNTRNDADINTTTISSLINIPSITYSLNIFNTLDGRNEVLAQPSIVALANERSEFFSGVDVVAAAVSGGDGSSVSIDKEIGVKLSIVPEFLPNDHIKLQVEAERTFLTTPSRSVEFQFRLDTSKTTVNANVVMKFGETLVLSGLSEKETENSRDAVPFIGDIPIIQYLFAREGTRNFRKSVIILLTPRRTQYINQDVQDRAETEAQLSAFEQSVRKFEERNEHWFVPRSAFADALEATRSNSLFHEFKTGDFALESWNSRDTHGERLRGAIDFLFY